MPHVEQQSHGCTTLASKHANHLTTSKVRARLLPVHTTLYDARTNDRETQCDRKRRTRSPLNFKHAQKSDATAGERKIACNGSDSSCNVGEPSCERQKAGSQSVLKWSCANCERGFTADDAKDFLNRSVRQYIVLSLLSDGNSSQFELRGWEGSL